MQRSRSSAIVGEIGIGFSNVCFSNDHPRVSRAVTEGQILQRALAALVADGAVEWVVDEDELERPLLTRRRLLGRACRLDDHPLGRGQRAPGLELRHALKLDEAHAARADGLAEARLVTEDGDLDAGRLRRFDDARPLRDLDRALVDLDRYEVAHTSTSSFVCMSEGARIPSSDDVPWCGQPPPSTCAMNSSRHLWR